jgi:hypothetical protein
MVLDPPDDREGEAELGASIADRQCLRLLRLGSAAFLLLPNPPRSIVTGVALSEVLEWL